MNSYYLGVDLNLPEKMEVVRLKQKMGYLGFGLYMELILRLAQAKDYKLQCDYELIAYQFRLEVEHVKSVIENFGLFTIENDFFWCDEVIEKMEILESKKAAARKAGIASGKARSKKKETVVERSFERSLNNKGNKEKEIKKGNKEKETAHPPLQKFKSLLEEHLPEVVDNPIEYVIWNSINQYNDWEEYFVWCCKNQKKREMLYKDIAWKDWMRKDYHASKLAQKHKDEPHQSSDYPYQQYERPIEPQLTPQQKEENKKHFAEMMAKLKTEVKKA